MTQIDPARPLAEIVLDHSETALVFQKHHLDYCCRGNVSLDQACRDRGIARDEVVRELVEAIEDRLPRELDPRTLASEELIEYIVSRHHEYLRDVLPMLQSLATKVARVHGEHNPKLHAIATSMRELTETLLAHLDFEEDTLFPAMLGERDLDRELDDMLDEHLEVGELLEQIREAADDYTLPDYACRSYRVLFGEMQALEADIHRHVHLENFVLAPRFAAH